MTNPQARIDAIVQSAREQFESRGGTATLKRERPRVRREWTRQIVRTDRLDQIEWHGNQDDQHAWYTSTPLFGVRNDPEVDEAINDLFYGNTRNQEERPGYLNGPELLQDVFYTFYQAVPKLHDKAEVIKDARLNGKFIEQLMGLPVFEEIRDYSITDPDTAKGAMLALVDVIKEMIKQHREQVEQSNSDRQESGCDPSGPPGNSDNQSWDEENQQEGGGSGQGQPQDGEPQDNWEEQEQPESQSGQGQPGDGEPQDAGEGDGDGDGEPEDGEGDAEGDEDEGDSGAEQDETDWQGIADSIGARVNAALQDFVDEQEELRTTLSGIGCSPEEWKAMDPSRRLALANRLKTPKLQKVTDLAGRMKRFALSRQAEKVNDSPEEIFTIEQGDDLTRVVPSELAYLAHPSTKLWFYYKLANRDLMLYRKRGKEKIGKGPIVLAVDNSGSMGGQKEDWAKGVAEALRRVAEEQGRDFYVIFFEENSHRERFDFPKGRGPLEKVVAYLSIQAGGGTDFDGVLTEALQRAQTYGEGEQQGKADIVLITDGDASPPAKWIEKFNAERKEAGVRVFSIYINAYDSVASRALRLLTSFSDIVIPVRELTVNDDTTSELFVTI